MRRSARLPRLIAGLATAAVLSSGVVVGGVVAVSSAIAATQTLVATTDVNLRSGPANTYPILTVVPQGGAVNSTGEASGLWLPVTFNGIAGYINSTYLAASAAPAPSPSPSTPTTAGSAVTTTDVNVRTGPGTTYSIVTVAAQGTSVSTTGITSGNWTQVLWSGTARWISSTYLAVSAPAPTPSPTPTPTPTPTVVGQVRTTTDLNLRTEGYLGAPIYGVLPANSIVDVTGNVTSTYVQILYSGTPLWISNKYIVPVSTTPPADTSTAAAAVVQYAVAHLGAAYEYGAAGPDVFDCSGLVSAAYASAGVSIPHSMSQQATLGTPVAYADLKPGDVLIWGSPVTAVSIYIGNDQLIMADGYDFGVRQVSLSSRMSWASFDQGRRYVS